MRDPSDGGRARTDFSAVLYGGAAFYFVRYRGDIFVSVGPGLQAAAGVRLCGDVALHYNFAGWLHIPLEEGRARLESLRGVPRERTHNGIAGS
jgi:hypothetical protein